MDTAVKDFVGHMIFQGRNAQRENLLHYICKRDQYELVEPLVSKGCRLCQQDVQGRTPIHVALDKGHHKCLAAFVEILQNYAKQSASIQRDLRTLFKLYNNQGYTILHEAALLNMSDVVRALLQFCQDQHINVADQEVLGCGDSVVHLLVRENLVEMAAIVCEYMPQLVKYRNYAGILPQDLNCITEEMCAVLKRALRHTHNDI